MLLKHTFYHEAVQERIAKFIKYIAFFKASLGLQMSKQYDWKALFTVFPAANKQHLHFISFFSQFNDK